MHIRYDPQSGEIVGTISGDFDPEDAEYPTINVSDTTEVKNKKVNVKTGEIGWSYSIDGAKQLKIQEIKERANRVLSETDWFVVRKQETGESIPQSVIDHRAEVRSLSEKFESEVNGLDSVDEVLAYSFEYPDPPDQS